MSRIHRSIPDFPAATVLGHFTQHIPGSRFLELEIISHIVHPSAIPFHICKCLVWTVSFFGVRLCWLASSAACNGWHVPGHRSAMFLWELQIVSRKNAFTSMENIATFFLVVIDAQWIYHWLFLLGIYCLIIMLVYLDCDCFSLNTPMLLHLRGGNEKPAA